MVDRSADLDALIALIGDAAVPADASRVVAVVGPGGFGKASAAGTMAIRIPTVRTTE